MSTNILTSSASALPERKVITGVVGYALVSIAAEANSRWGVQIDEFWIETGKIVLTGLAMYYMPPSIGDFLRRYQGVVEQTANSSRTNTAVVESSAATLKQQIITAVEGKGHSVPADVKKTP